MTSRPSLLFYCQHSLGLGHLARSLALCGALAERFGVVLLSGGTLPPGIAVPQGVDVVALPPLALAPDRSIVSEDARHTVAQAYAVRRERILGALRATRPDVLVVELFPFGRRRFADEIVALLVQARSRHRARPLVACSLRDILVGRGVRQARHDDRAVAIANRYFDAVLVHCDPDFARLEDSLAPTTPLLTPVHYTGFVMAPRPPHWPPTRRAPVVVSAGGGRVGAPLLSAAVEAHALLGPRAAMKVIGGPLLAQQDWRALEHAAHGREGLELVRSVPDLEAELAAASASVSQCGYNTALEVVRARVPALVVPFAEGGEDEQTRRARRLEALGAVRVLDPGRLGAQSLATEIERLARFTPRPWSADMDGAAQSADLLSRLLDARKVA